MKTQFLKLPDGEIAYDDSGSGPLVVCIPSLGDLRGEYRFLAPQLVEAGYRVVCMDVRGHGETTTLWPDYSVAGVGSDLVALVRALNAGPAAVIGTSMAAGAAVWAAAEAPELFSGLVTVGPFVRGDGDWLLKMVMSVLFARPWGPSSWQRYYSTLYPTRKPADFEEYTLALRSNLKEPGRMEAVLGMLMASKKASEVRLPLVKVPVLVLMGSKDPDFKKPEDEARLVAEGLHGTYTMIENAGHYPHAEMPEVFAPLVLAFLQSLKEAEGSRNVA